jgi:hypothetical protein
MDKFAGSFVSKTTDMISTSLMEWSMMQFAMGNIPAGVAAAAAAAAVQTMGGAASASFGGSSPSVSTGGGGSSTSSENQGNPINLTIKLEGKNVKDKDFMAIMAKGLNSYVIDNNGKVVSSTVKGSTSTPGALA